MDYYTYLREINYIQSDYSDFRAMESPWPLTFQDKSSQYLLNKSVENIKGYILDENNDSNFYTKLITLAPNENQKNIIEGIRDDEKIHVQIFRKIFMDLTGVVLPASPTPKETSSNNITYIDGLKQAFFGELEAVKKYREIMAYMPSKDLANMFFYIISDEIRHASLYNYLLMENK